MHDHGHELRVGELLDRMGGTGWRGKGGKIGTTIIA